MRNSNFAAPLPKPSAQKNDQPTLSYKDMVAQIGRTWARRSNPKEPVAKIQDVIKDLSQTGAWNWIVVYDEVGARGQKKDGWVFQQYYMPCEHGGALAQLPKDIGDAIVAFERELGEANKILVVTPVQRELQLNMQVQARARLVRVLTPFLTRR